MGLMRFVPNHYSISGLTTAERCGRRYEMEYIYRLTPKEIGLSLAFGKAGHEGLGEYYRKGRDIEEGVDRFKLFWTPFERKDTSEILTQAKGEEILRAYHEQFGKVEDDEFEVVHIEYPFTVDLACSDLPFVGVIDLILRDRLGGELIPVEWKFTKSSWGFVSRPNSQIVGYARATSVITKEKVERVIFHLNGIYKSSEKGLVSGKKKADMPRSIFKRDPIDLDPWDFQEWDLDVEETLENIRRWEMLGYYPKKTSSCGDFGGCPFIPICIAPPSQREFFMESNFGVKEEK